MPYYTKYPVNVSYGLNVGVLLKFICWSLIPSVTVLRGRGLDHEGSALMNGIGILRKEVLREPTCPIHHVRTQ